jgi:hypothetical protein
VRLQLRARSFPHDDIFVGEALAGQDVGIEVVDALRVRAWFRDIDLGVLETLPEVDVSCFEQPPPSRKRRAS